LKDTGKIINSKVLVTGGAGFIGSNLIETLIQQNNKIICLDNFATGKKENINVFLNNPNFHFIEGDIRDIEMCRKAVANVDIVLHQAALGSVPRSLKDPKTTNDVNVGGFVNMLFAAKDAGIKRFVYASSSSVYGDSPDLPKVEEKIGTPLSPYAVSKLTNEIYAQNFSKVYGIETMGLRYFNVFGKRQDPNGPYAAVIPKFINQLLKGESITINGDPNISRDFTYVDNVIQANQLAATCANKEALNTVYNVACGESSTLEELIATLKEILSNKVPEAANIKIVIGLERAGDVKHSLASVGKAKSLLGYNPEYNVNLGLKHTISSYL
jgi:UDP-N-acetylglucosamine/UDP-N-acetylgalactosamine 4-epimerase